MYKDNRNYEVRLRSRKTTSAFFWDGTGLTVEKAAIWLTQHPTEKHTIVRIGLKLVLVSNLTNQEECRIPEDTWIIYTPTRYILIEENRIDEEWEIINPNENSNQRYSNV